MALVGLFTSNPMCLIAVTLIVGFVYYLYKLAFVTDIPEIPDIPERTKISFG